MPNEKAVTCWEYWDDPPEVREKCPAYKAEAGRECFYLTPDYCPIAKRDFRFCVECPWFKKVYPSE